jgi:hypothetical protein
MGRLAGADISPLDIRQFRYSWKTRTCHFQGTLSQSLRATFGGICGIF